MTSLYPKFLGEGDLVLNGSQRIWSIVWASKTTGFNTLERELSKENSRISDRWTFIRKVLPSVLANMKMKRPSHYQRTQASYKNVLRYLEFLAPYMETILDSLLLVGEAGCLGYSFVSSARKFQCGMCDPCQLILEQHKKKDQNRQKMRRSLLILGTAQLKSGTYSNGNR